jgi:hypothetical protein
MESTVRRGNAAPRTGTASPTVQQRHSDRLLGGAVVQNAIAAGTPFVGGVLMASVPPYGLLSAVEAIRRNVAPRLDFE